MQLNNYLLLKTYAGNRSDSLKHKKVPLKRDGRRYQVQAVFFILTFFHTIVWAIAEWGES